MKENIYLRMVMVIGLCTFACDEYAVTDGMPSAPSSSTAPDTNETDPSVDTAMLTWVTSAGGPHYDSVEDILETVDGSLLVTGGIEGLSAVFGAGEENETHITYQHGEWDHHAYLAKYNSDGTLDWANAIDGDRGIVIDVFQDGSILLGGNCQANSVFGAGQPNETQLGPCTSYVARYTSGMVLEWAECVAGDLRDLAVAEDGSFFVTGRTTQGLDPGEDSFMVLGQGESNETLLSLRGMYISQYRDDGSLLWAKSAGGEDNHNLGPFFNTARTDVAELLPLKDGAVLVTGNYDRGQSTFEDGADDAITLEALNGVYLAQYSANGLEWVKSVEFDENNLERYSTQIGAISLIDEDLVRLVFSVAHKDENYNQGVSLSDEVINYVGDFRIEGTQEGTLMSVKHDGDDHYLSDIVLLSDGSYVSLGSFFGQRQFRIDGQDVLMGESDMESNYMAKYSDENKLEWVAANQEGMFYEKTILTSSDTFIIGGNFIKPTVLELENKTIELLPSDDHGEGDLYLLECTL